MSSRASSNGPGIGARPSAASQRSGRGMRLSVAAMRTARMVRLIRSRPLLIDLESTSGCVTALGGCRASKQPGYPGARADHGSEPERDRVGLDAGAARVAADGRHGRLVSKLRCGLIDAPGCDRLHPVILLRPGFNTESDDRRLLCVLLVRGSCLPAEADRLVPFGAALARPHPRGRRVRQSRRGSDRGKRLLRFACDPQPASGLGEGVEVARQHLDLSGRCDGFGVEGGVHRDAVDERVYSLGLVVDVEVWAGSPVVVKRLDGLAA